MKFFTDTAELSAIKHLNDIGLIDGVTTNPSLIRKSGRDFFEVLFEICEIVDGPVSAEVVGETAEQMIAEGEKLASLSTNICIKLPLTIEGLIACKTLVGRGFKTNVTLCFSVSQALLAAKAGATFVSPFVGRLDDVNSDGMSLIRDIRTVYDNYGLKTNILAASIRTVNHISDAAIIGADAVTVPPETITKMVEHPLTSKGLEQFMSDWNATGQSII